MEPARAAQALAEASSAMTQEHDVVGALATLLDHCGTGLGVDVSGILVESAGRLELLASSSHEASRLETLQLHADQGPCIDAYVTGATVQAHSAAELTERWPEFAQTMLGAGFTSVHASPLVFQKSTFGAMGLFRRADDPFTPDEDVVARAFADIATMLILHLGAVPVGQLEARLKDALEARVVLEQAKGVLADSQNLSMGEAYVSLLQGARANDKPLTEWAEHVVARAQHRPEGR
jgi:transcriptional regulator with GAF, ATPase, and Fis domain